MSEYIRVAGAADIGDGETRKIDVSGMEILVAKVNGEYFAVEKCTHKGAPLHEGSLSGSVLTCPWHKSEFDVKTGKVVKIPFPPRYGTTTDLKTFEVRVEGSDLLVKV